jgi:hypothetical protein
MRNYRTNVLRGLFLILAFCFSGIAYAQDTTGSIFGTVTDTSGATVPGATVTIKDMDKGIVVRTIVTDDNGAYSAPQLPVANYEVTVEAPSFKKYIENKIKLDVNQRRTVDATMVAGDISESVVIEADPLQVELQSATASTLISGDQVRELSINNRNFVQLVTLAPGVSNDLADQVFVGTVNPDGQANTVNISVNGARSSQNTFTVDGADITDRGSNITIQAYPSVDSIGEFKVLRSLYPAESGNSGGGQVNVVTRSGTDKFHGSLFEFIRNEALNANDFLSNQTAPVGRTPEGKAKRRPFRYNNYGVTIGGPVYLFNFGEGPGGMFRKLKRTFFFFSEEQRRDLRYPALTSTVPDAALRQGIFPIDVCINRNDISTETCTGANRLPAGTPLPANRFNPTAQAYVTQIYNKLPLPTNAATYALISAAVNRANFRQEILKIDHSFTNNWSAFYRFQNDKIPTLDANALFSSGSGLPGVSTTETNSPGKAHTFQTTYVISPNTILEGRYTYSYGAILSSNVGTLSNQVSSIPVNLPFANTRDRVPSVATTLLASANGFSPLTGFGPYDNFSDKHNAGLSLSMIRGVHTFKFGGNVSRYRKNENALVGDGPGPNQGNFTSFSATLPTGVTASALNQNIQRWANFLVGNAASFRQAKFDYTADLRQKNLEAYAQDEWRFRPNLTVYMGVRYSIFGQPIDKNGRLTNFIPELFNPANAPRVTGDGNLVAGTGNFCNGMIVNSQNLGSQANCSPTVSPFGETITSTNKGNFAPRFGLAWDPFGKGTTAIRTGYGIYHEQILVGWDEQIIGQNPPFQENVDFTNVRLDNPAAAAAGAPSGAARTIRARQSDWKTPYMQHWSLDWQQQLGKNTVFTVGYYGSKGTHLIGIVEINELPLGRAIASQCATGANTLQTAGATLVQCQAPGTGFLSGAATNILDQIRPYRGYRSITMMQPRFNSNYHSLQISAQRRFAQTSQVNLAYTWAKNLTDSQNDRTNAPQNSYDIKSEYSRATLDRRHVFTLNYIYELPFFTNGKGFLGQTLGGWQASGIVTAQSGLPFTATTSNLDPGGLGLISALVAGSRPNLLCDPNENAPHTQQQYFNTSCFQVNPATNSGLGNAPGTAGRGIIEGPPTYRVDFTMTKIFRFGETTRLQIRGEAFNIFNHTNFRGFSSLNRTSTLFGIIGSVRDPRTIQLGAKFIF